MQSAYDGAAGDLRRSELVGNCETDARAPRELLFDDALSFGAWLQAAVD